MGQQDVKSIDNYVAVLVAIPKDSAPSRHAWLNAHPDGVAVVQGPLPRKALKDLLGLKALLKDDGFVNLRVFREAVKVTGSSGGMSSVYPRISFFLARQRGEEVIEDYSRPPETPLAELLELAHRSPNPRFLKELNVGLSGFCRFQLACGFLAQARSFPG